MSTYNQTDNMASDTTRKTVIDHARLLREVALVEKMGGTSILLEPTLDRGVNGAGVAFERKMFVIEATFFGTDIQKARDQSHAWYGRKA